MERMGTFLCPSPKIRINGIAANNKNRSVFNPNGANMKSMLSSNKLVKRPFNPSGQKKKLLMPMSNQMKQPAESGWKTPDRKSDHLFNGGFTFAIEDNHHHYIDEDGDAFYTPNKKPNLFNDGSTFSLHESGSENRDRCVTFRNKPGYRCRDLMKTIDVEDEIVENSD